MNSAGIFTSARSLKKLSHDSGRRERIMSPVAGSWRIKTSLPSKRNSTGSRTAWLRPLRNSFAVRMMIVDRSKVIYTMIYYKNQFVIYFHVQKRVPIQHPGHAIIRRCTTIEMNTRMRSVIRRFLFGLNKKRLLKMQAQLKAKADCEVSPVTKTWSGQGTCLPKGGWIGVQNQSYGTLVRVYKKYGLPIPPQSHCTNVSRSEIKAPDDLCPSKSGNSGSRNQFPSACVEADVLQGKIESWKSPPDQRAKPDQNKVPRDSELPERW